jgi:GH18 family chitinase
VFSLPSSGWNEGSTRFSPLVASAERRSQLVKNSIKFLRQNKFDGLDLDWGEKNDERKVNWLTELLLV